MTQQADRFGGRLRFLHTLTVGMTEPLREIGPAHLPRDAHEAAANAADHAARRAPSPSRSGR